MKATLTINIDFEPWMDNPPKNNEEWLVFFNDYFEVASVMGEEEVDEDGNQNQIMIERSEIIHLAVE